MDDTIPSRNLRLPTQHAELDVLVVSRCFESRYCKSLANIRVQDDANRDGPRLYHSDARELLLDQEGNQGAVCLIRNNTIHGCMIELMSFDEGRW